MELDGDRSKGERFRRIFSAHAGMLSRAVLAASSPEIPEKKLPKPGVAPTASQYRRSLARARVGPPSTNPSTRMAPLMTPALVPVTPMMSLVASSNRRSSTPHVKAPCDPPPCNARASLRRGGSEWLSARRSWRIDTPRLTVLFATRASLLSSLYPGHD